MSISNILVPNSYDIYANSINAIELNVSALGVTSIAGNGLIVIAPDGVPGPINPNPDPISVVIQKETGNNGLAIVGDIANLQAIGVWDIANPLYSGGFAVSREAFGQSPPNTSLIMTVDSKPAFSIIANGSVVNSDFVIMGPTFIDNGITLNNTVTRCLSIDSNNLLIEKDLSTVFNQTLNVNDNVIFSLVDANNLTLRAIGLDNASDRILVQDSATDIVGYINKNDLLSSGFFNSTWTTLSGFVSGPTTAFTMIWTKVGSVVSVNFWADPPAPVLGSNTASFTLPVPRSSNFTSNTQLNGQVAATDTRLSSSRLEADTGNLDVGLLTLNVSAGGAVTLEGQFSYYLD